MVSMWLKKGGYVVLCTDWALEGAMRREGVPGETSQGVCGERVGTERAS